LLAQCSPSRPDGIADDGASVPVAVDDSGRMNRNVGNRLAESITRQKKVRSDWTTTTQRTRRKEKRSEIGMLFPNVVPVVPLWFTCRDFAKKMLEPPHRIAKLL